MFIVDGRWSSALRQEGHDHVKKGSTILILIPTIGARGRSDCITDMALLTEGDRPSPVDYKHGPPDGGRPTIARRL
jgi:hypothetical protein